MNTKAWVAAAAFLSTGLVHATCFSVYKADGSLLQEGSTTPVNMALPIGDTVPEKFGAGTTMTVSDLGVYCKDRRGGASADMPALPEEPKKDEKVAIKQAAPEAAR